MKTLESVVLYLTDNGMDEKEVDYFLKSRIFKGKSVLDYIREDKWAEVWAFVKNYMYGETW